MEAAVHSAAQCAELRDTSSHKETIHHSHLWSAIICPNTRALGDAHFMCKPHVQRPPQSFTQTVSEETGAVGDGAAIRPITQMYITHTANLSADTHVRSIHARLLTFADPFVDGVCVCWVSREGWVIYNKVLAFFDCVAYFKPKEAKTSFRSSTSVTQANCMDASLCADPYSELSLFDMHYIKGINNQEK